MPTLPMHIEHLGLHHFRNLQPTQLHVQSQTVVLRGQNAQGKTNILEALYVAATGKSFRNALPRELLQHRQKNGQVSARFVRQGVRHDVDVAFDGSRRYLKIDGRGVRQRTKLLDLVNVIAFFPDDLRVVKGSPEERRRFLDRAIANHRADFIEACSHYTKALKSRNALLRAPKKPDKTLLEVYDQQLLRYGTVLYNARVDTLAALLPLTQEYFAKVMGSKLALDLQIHPGFSAALDTDFTAAFAQALHKNYGRDCAVRQTTAGPHRADLLIRIGGEDARHFASQGQQRTVVLALKLAEVAYLGAHLGCAPILLLDDVSSELDSQRTQELFALIGSSNSQVWLSTTGAAPLPWPAAAQVLDVHEGHVAGFSQPHSS